MSIDGPRFEPLETALPEQEQAPWVEEIQAQTKELLAKLESQTMRKLAAPREEALLAEVQEGRVAASEWLAELKSQIDAMDVIEDNFSMFDNYEQFEAFLDGGGLSPQEFDNLLAKMADETAVSDMEMELMMEWLPVDRESYVLFADLIGIPTSTTEVTAEINDKNLEEFERLQGIAGNLASIPWGISADLDTFRSMLTEAQSMDPESVAFRAMRDDALEFLLWADFESNEGGSLDTILKDLKDQDAANVADGNPSHHYDLFARNMRDFSPAVARRIEHFEANYENSSPADGEPASTYQRSVIKAGLPAEAGSNVSMNGVGEYVASLPDGSQVTVVQDGNHISRSINMDGVDYPLSSPVEAADFSQAHAEFIAVQQEAWGNLQKTENALSFLENPKYADAPLEDMKDSLLQILGQSLYGELGVRDMTDKAELIQKLEQDVGMYQKRIEDAQKLFQEKAKAAVARARERYRENDERLKQTLKVMKNSGLGELGVDYIISQIKGQMIVPELWVPFDPQNIDPENSNFWEPTGLQGNETAHIEYMYRIANKIITGSPDGMVDGQLVGFSLEQAIMYPDVAQKTDSERNAMLAASGVWDEFRGTDKQELAMRLESPVE